MALDRGAAQAANDDFYTNHAELVKNGERIPINSNMDNYDDLRLEWKNLYRSHLADGNESSAGNVEAARRDAYILAPAGKPGEPVKASLQSHVFVVRSAQLLVDFQWPLAGYYVYLDTDLTDGVDFDTLGLLWTDEKGMLHRTDGDGKPIGLVPPFAIVFATDKPDIVMSVALLYDHDRDRLAKRKKDVQKEAKRHNIASTHLIADGRMTIFADSFKGSSNSSVAIYVPRDSDVLDVPRLAVLKDKCDKAIQEAQAAQKKILDFVKKNVLYFRRLSYVSSFSWSVKSMDRPPSSTSVAVNPVRM